MTRILDAAHWPPRDVLVKVIPGSLVISLCYVFLTCAVHLRNLQQASVEGKVADSNALGLSLLGDDQTPKESPKKPLARLDGLAVVSFRSLRILAVVALITIQCFQLSNTSGGYLDFLLLINYVSELYNEEAKYLMPLRFMLPFYAQSGPFQEPGFVTEATTKQPYFSSWTSPFTSSSTLCRL